MILSDTEIRRRIESWSIGFEISQWGEQYDILKQIWPASLDFRLWNAFKIYRKSRKTYIDVKEWVDPDHIETIILKDGDSFILHPWDFVLWVTLEKIKVPYDLVARCEWRSSLWRLWLIIHSTAGFVDPGFEWTITLEMTNINVLPIKLYVGMKIWQYAFETLEWVVETPYNVRKSSKYMGQVLPEESRISLDLER
jgi:dCTP deaminase